MTGIRTRPLTASRDADQPDSRVETIEPAGGPVKGPKERAAAPRATSEEGVAQTSETFRSRAETVEIEPAVITPPSSASEEDALRRTTGRATNPVGLGGVYGPPKPTLSSPMRFQIEEGAGPEETRNYRRRDGQRQGPPLLPRDPAGPRHR
jgi:hypothetical protein